MTKPNTQETAIATNALRQEPFQTVSFKSLRLIKAVLVGEQQLDKFADTYFTLTAIGNLIFITRNADQAKTVTHLSNLHFGFPKE